MARESDPFPGCNFLLEIDGIVTAGFMSCSGLEAEIEVIEYREGTDPRTLRKLRGSARYTNVVLQRGVTQSTELSEWFRASLTQPLERRGVAVILLSDLGDPAARWELREAWPCRLTGPELHAMKQQVAIETLELCHEGLQRIGMN